MPAQSNALMHSVGSLAQNYIANLKVNLTDLGAIAHGTGQLALQGGGELAMGAGSQQAIASGQLAL